MNQYEAQQISELLTERGFLQAKAGEKAELAVVHGCAVTSRAMAKSRQAARTMLARHDTVLLSGCAARWARQGEPELEETIGLVCEARDIAKVLCKLGNGPNTVGTKSASISQESTAHGGDKQCMRTMPAMSGAVAGSPIKPLSNGIPPETSRQVKRKNTCCSANLNGDPGTDNGALGPISKFFGHERAFVKVQDGCDCFCSYCIVPYLRTEVSWRPVGEVLDEIAGLLGNGYREVVLTGVHLGAYGFDSTVRAGRDRRGQASLAELVELAARTPGLQRLRLSSLEPGEVGEELLEVMANSAIVAAHLHLPLQSGSDRILKAMRRPYGSADFRKVVERIRVRWAGATITTDVIVGFPGESEQDFQETMSLAREVGFARMHIFEYSARKGTAAAGMANQIRRSVRQERSRRMRSLASELARQYQESLRGRELRVLVESKRSPDGFQAGLCEQYFSVRFAADEDLTGRMVRVQMEKVDDIGACGRLLGVESETVKAVS